MEEIIGIPGSGGIAVGRVLCYENKPFTLPMGPIPAGGEGDQRAALAAAVETVKADLLLAAQCVRQEAGPAEAEIFEAHISVLTDPQLAAAAEANMVCGRLPAATAFWQAARAEADLFTSLQDDYLSARAADVLDVAERVVRRLTGEAAVSLAALEEPCIVVAKDITPSDTARMEKRKVLALVSEMGSHTSHAVILARSLGIPAVVGAAGIRARLATGDLVIVDGNRGSICLSPDPQALALARKRSAEGLLRQDRLRSSALSPALTQDGVQILVQGNIGAPAEAALVTENGGDGVGLFRSEFFYMGQTDFPSEQLQYEGYCHAVAALEGRPLIVRTMDIGADKHLAYFDLPQEENPALGWRALRIGLERPDIFRPQIRALLRAAATGKLSIMLPMVSSLDEILAAKAMIADCKAELDREGLPYNAHTPLGIMIEIPAIALQARAAAELVDFFSIGTNDLLQYTLAVDRMNRQVAGLYRPFHPAFLGLLAMIVAGAHAADIPVGMCGELAGDPLATALLLGLGLDGLSMAPASIPAVKDRLRHLSAADCRSMAAHALGCATADEVAALLEGFAHG
ncbi:MAG: phosphoenolpyruvate--protein phosphotransferase [Pseudoflavonifractor sp.]